MVVFDGADIDIRSDTEICSCALTNLQMVVQMCVIYFTSSCRENFVTPFCINIFYSPVHPGRIKKKLF